MDRTSRLQDASGLEAYAPEGDRLKAGLQPEPPRYGWSSAFTRSRHPFILPEQKHAPSPQRKADTASTGLIGTVKGNGRAALIQQGHYPG